MTAARLSNQTVLLVEDDPMLRGILADALSSEGHPVITARSGEEALRLASSLVGRLALVVTDILLPAMDGLELAERLACLSPPPAVLFISGLRNERALPGPVLKKPFGPTAFLEQVGRMCGAGRTTPG